jgi:hypothetical protein
MDQAVNDVTSPRKGCSADHKDLNAEDISDFGALSSSEGVEQLDRVGRKQPRAFRKSPNSRMLAANCGFRSR